MPTKIIFHLQKDADGYPPVAYEGLWAEQDEHGNYIIDNIPFFTREATLGDVVYADNDAGEMVFAQLVSATLNSLIRIVYFRDDVITYLRDALQNFGCATELDAVHHLIAVHIPAHVEIASVQEFLFKGFQAEQWDYEEAIIRHPI